MRTERKIPLTCSFVSRSLFCRSHNKEGAVKNKGSLVGLCIALGIGIGVAIGTAMNNIGAGIAIGASIGVILAIAFGFVKKEPK